MSINENPILGTPQNDYLVGTAGDDNIQGLEGDDDLFGDGGNDTLDGGSGNDRLFGGIGNDVYKFGRGSGTDRVENYDPYSNGQDFDVVQLGTDVAPGDVLIEVSGSDLIIRINGTTDSLRIRNYFTDGGSSYDYAVDEIRFADGTVWDKAYILAQQMFGTDEDQYIYGTNGDDTIQGLGGDDHIEGRAGNDTLDGGNGDDELRGGQGNDILIGGSGNDRLAGELGNDVYRFGRGSGQDVIDNSGSSSYTDVIELDASVAPGDLQVFAKNGGLVIRINGTTDTITVENHFYDENNSGIDQIKFADGTVWDKAYLFALQMVGTNDDQDIFGTSGNDTLLGLGGNDRIEGQAGNDTVDGGVGNDELNGGNGDDIVIGGLGNDEMSGGAGNDILTGGLGDDVMWGGSGNDSYRFQLGDGQDKIENTNSDTFTDVLEFGAGIAPTDLLVAMEGESLFIRFTLGSDSIEITNYNAGEYYKIDEIKFADGTVWDSTYIQTLQLRGLDVSQTIDGTETSDTIEALGGDDRVDGIGGDDTIDGGAGGDDITGGAGNDILAGGIGNDDLRGDTGNDVYRFGRGDGQDTIENYDTYSDGEDFDAVELGTGIAPEDVELVRNNSSLVIRVAGTADSLTILYFFDRYTSSDYEIDEIRFTDGTVWTKAYIYELLMRGTDEDQHITGTMGNDTIDAKGGDDRVEGMQGDDVLNGGDGVDDLRGGEGNDILIGGTSSDRMEGGYGNDIYRLEAGFGSDHIFNQGGSSDIDRIEFGAGMTPANALVWRDGSGLIIGFTGSADQVRISEFFSGSSYQIDEVVFVDGTVWGVADLIERHLLPHEKDQYMYGTVGADTLDGGGGHDRLYGDAGDDHLIGGSGSDQLDGGTGNDTLDGGEDGDTLYGQQGADMLVGGVGSDRLVGGDGGDVYRFSLGDGSDRIEEGDNPDAGLETDAIELGIGILTDDVVLRRDGDDMVLEILGTTDAIRVVGHFADYYYEDRQIDEIRFADGTVWGAVDILARTLTLLEGTDTSDSLQGTALNDLIVGGYGDDNVLGGAGDDVLLGGGGDDVLNGGEGNDRYQFDEGFGADTIRNFDDYGNGIDTDVVRFGAGIVADDLTASSADDNLILTNTVTGDVLTLAGFFAESADGNSDGRIDAVKFSDGTAWAVEDLILKQMYGNDADQTVHGRSVADVIDAGAGNDTVHGHDGDDVLTGGLGDDRLAGGRGSDEYHFESGWGHDTINNTATGAAAQDTDAVVFGADILPDEILVSSNGVDLVLMRAASGDSVTVTGFFTLDGSNAEGRIQQVRFANGTVWGVAELTARQMVGTDADQYLHGSVAGDSINAGYGNDLVYGHQGDDVIAGGDGDDLLDGGIGADSLDGGEGNDTFVFAQGSGFDQVISRDEYGQYYDIVQFGPGIAPSDVSIQRTGIDLVLSVAGTDDRLLVKSFFPQDMTTGYPDAIDEIWFADGTIWDIPYLLSSVRPYILGTEQDDSLIGIELGEDIEGGGGNDFIDGKAGDDLLVGGAGDDTMVGSRGNDEYIFELGWGHDTVNNHDDYVDGADIADAIRFGEGIGSQDIVASHVVDIAGNYHLVLTHVVTGDSVTVQNYFSEFVDGSADAQIDEIRFYDGTIWTRADLEALFPSDVWGARYMLGGAGNDVIDAGGGNDSLFGGAGNDVLIGGAGNDQIIGGAGDDVFRFESGWGHDQIGHQYPLEGTGFDVIEFGPGVVAADIVVRQNPTDHAHLLVESAVAGDMIEIQNYFSPYAGQGYDYLFDEIRFADGTVWSQGDLLARVFAGTEADQDLSGTRFDDLIDTAGGNDQVRGNDGADTLSGGAGDDFLSGGAGSDTLDGGDGNDTFLFEIGTGSDVIHSEDANAQYIDKIMCGQGIAPTDIDVQHVGEDLLLTIIGTQDSLTVMGFFAQADGGTPSAIDEVRFNDGTTWDVAYIMSQFPGGGIVGTPGDDVLSGTVGDDAISALAGNDSVDGLSGNDVLDGGTGNDMIWGGVGNDTIIGGFGNDAMAGAAGDDRYIFETGHGVDTINNTEHLINPGFDTIEFGIGISPGDIAVSEVGTYLAFTNVITGEAVKVQASAQLDRTRGIDEVRFADGTIWDSLQILQLLDGASAGASFLEFINTQDVGVVSALGKSSLNAGEYEGGNPVYSSDEPRNLTYAGMHIGSSIGRSGAFHLGEGARRRSQAGLTGSPVYDVVANEAHSLVSVMASFRHSGSESSLLMSGDLKPFASPWIMAA